METVPSAWEKFAVVIGEPYIDQNLEQSCADHVFFTQKPRTQFTGIRPQAVKRMVERVASKEASQVSSRVQKLLNHIRPDFVVLAIQCQILSQIGSLLDYGDATRISFMWDHPSWWAKSHGLSDISSQKFVREWTSLQEHAHVRLLPSERARELFTELPGTRSEVLYPHLESPPRTIRNSFNRSSKQAKIRVAFAGQLYAKPEFLRFVKFLETAKWRGATGSIELHVFGSDPEIEHPDVHYHGWKPARNLVSDLAEMDVALLPYPSEDFMKVVARTSFPSKLSLYLSAGLPIIFVGPADSAAYSFIRQHGIGIRLEEILDDDLESMFVDDRATLLRRLSDVYDSFFSSRAFTQKISHVFSLKSHEIEGPHVSINRAAERVSSGQFSKRGLKSKPYETSETATVVVWNRPSVSKYLGYFCRPIFALRMATDYVLGNLKSLLRRVRLGDRVSGFLRMHSMNMFYMLKLHQNKKLMRPSARDFWTKGQTSQAE